MSKDNNLVNQGIATAAKRIDMKHNVSIRVLDEATGEVVSEHTGHNASTNSLLTGIAHYLTGEGVFNQGDILGLWVPQYISLGTMGLINQEEDEDGLPAGIGNIEGDEEARFIDYMTKCPGFGADGYDSNVNNNRIYLGLGPTFTDRPDPNKTVNCELITEAYPRAAITFRDIVPEAYAEYPKTIDVVFSAFISTGALAKFREPGKDHVFITEAGLWSRPDWIEGGDNGLLAGYRIAPPDEKHWDMSNPDNRRILKKNIIKVGPNQVAQIIWKIQLGGIDQLGSIEEIYPTSSRIRWTIWR